MKQLSRFKAVFLALLIGLFVVPILFESVLGWYAMPITGWQRPLWGLLFLGSSLMLLVLPLVSGVLARRISGLDIACVAAVVVAWVAYPAGIRTYCEMASRNRPDTWHWQKDDGLYYFVDKQHPDAFSGLIEVYPPHFSLPE
ncbi:hypothetical protein [Verrucomicrobium sp. BvORR106]|uniref:hypothetical protein n=1 Tax=Verrucomicrobium sp. BvORR106 TaxID=1403819 RepID=UPI00056E34E2|nr:hypothetical protein [Verrucomicrobium sp. BvORR106]